MLDQGIANVRNGSFRSVSGFSSANERQEKSFRLENVSQRRPPMSAPVRPTSALGFRAPRANPSSTITNMASFQPEASLLDENGLPLIGHLLAFTPDVIQVFQDAARLIEESREIKKQATNQIKDAFNDAKAYSLTVNQSVAQKLADIITLAVREIFDGVFCSLESAFFSNI